MADDIEYGPTRFVMHCTRCGERTAYPTRAIADDKLDLHHAFVHTAAGPRWRVVADESDGGVPRAADQRRPVGVDRPGPVVRRSAVWGLPAAVAAHDDGRPASPDRPRRRVAWPRGAAG